MERFFYWTGIVFWCALALALCYGSWRSFEAYMNEKKEEKLEKRKDNF